MKPWPDKEYITSICKIGEGAFCCRYLMMAPNGWLCAKLQPGTKELLDVRVAKLQMVARGDNCPGQR